ncbi:MAG: translation elongation factor Ts [Planctomycetaceae bacterium]|jgi:elongation factor Ts|nr:translation elongation factor Ts [Planctomycetaceae bacterium]
MAEVTAAAVKALRDLTDLPMMDCKKALVKAEGDQDKAVSILREQVGKVMLKRADNTTTEGRIVVKFNDDNSKAVMIEMQCESEPVSRSEDFLGFCDLCAGQLLNGPGAATPEELLAQTAEGQDKPLKEIYEEMVNKIREKIILSRLAVMDGQGTVNGYIHHDGKTGVLFAAKGDSADLDLLRDVGMHIAALDPAASNVEDLDEATVNAERDRLTEEAKASGKPENIIEKIVDGQMKKWYAEEAKVLIFQPFAKDDSKSVKQALAEKGLTASSYVRWVIGG